MKKFLILVLTVFVLSTVVLAFSACGDKTDATPSGIYKDGALTSEFVKDGDVYYAKVANEGVTSLAVVDQENKTHTVTLDSSSTEYTIVSYKENNEYKVEAWPKKRAIVWVAALLAGGFYDVEEDEPVWDPLPYDDVKLIEFINPDNMSKGISKLVRKLIPILDDLVMPILNNEQSKDNLIWSMSLNGYGVPNNPDLVPAIGIDHRVQYGVLSAYQEHAEQLKEEFADTDVVIFDYDWRMDNRDSSAALQKYIYDHKYTDVVMFSHSLGGNIVAGYLANNALNRAVVKRYVSFGGAFLGSFDALFAIENTQKYLMAVMENMGMDITGMIPPALLGLLDGIDVDAIFGVLSDLLVNMYSFPQLVPTFDLISGKQFGENGDGVAFTVDGKAITTSDELYAFYQTRPWAWQRNEKNEYVYDENGNHVVREVVKDLKNYHDSLYVQNADGTRTFSTFLVDTCYVTGSNIITFCGADYVGSGEDAELSYRTTLNGDKQVLLYSTLINQDPSEIPQEKFIVFEGKDHFQVGCDYELIKDVILDNIREVFYPETLTE